MARDEFDLGECLDRARQHDSEAARASVEQLYPLVIRIVRSHLPRRMAEEDLAQDVFVKLFARLDQYQARQDIPFEHWVSRLTVRTCLDALRAEQRRPEVRWSELSEEQSAWMDFMVEDDAPAPDAGAGSARELVEKLLRELPPQDRLVIHSLDLDERSVKEIAQITGWSVTRVKVRAFRARRKLRKIAESFKDKERYEQV